MNALEFNADDFLSLSSDLELPPSHIPDITPVSILDIERIQLCVDMYLHMSDPCPECGAFNMMTGDYICYGCCTPCFEKKLEEDPYAF